MQPGIARYSIGHKKQHKQQKYEKFIAESNSQMFKSIGGQPLATNSAKIKFKNDLTETIPTEVKKLHGR